MAEHKQPDWLSKIPFDVLNLIAQRTRNPIRGLTTFRSVCRTWRAAVGPAPRLLPPSPQNVADVLDNSDYRLVFPLSRGWSIVVDARDVSSHLSHLATGTTAALPKLNTVCDGSATCEIRHLFYEHLSDLELLFSPEEPAECSERKTTPPDVDGAGDPDDQSTDQDVQSSYDGISCEDENEAPSFNEDGAREEYDDKAPSSDEGSSCEKSVCEYPDDKPIDDQEVPSSEDSDEQFTDDEADSFDMDSLYRKYILPVVYHCREHKIKFYSHYGHESHFNYNGLSNYFRFAAHIPPSTPAGTTEGMVIMMYHRLHGTNGIVFWRPGDTAWTMIGNPNSNTSFGDFAYFDGKMFAIDKNCVTLVFDAMTLEVLYQIDVPPATFNFGFKLCGSSGREEFEFLHLVALPHKLLLVKVLMNYCEPHGPYSPYGFHVFELWSGSEDAEGLAWRSVTVDEGVGGNYEIFMDAYHATYSNSGDGRGTRIYHADNELFGSARCVWGHCYNMQDNKLKRVYQPLKDDCNEYSTKPSWFVP